MKYKVPGKKLDSMEAITARYMTGVDRQEADMEGIAYIRIKDTELRFFGESEEHPHMPYLKIYGDVVQVDGDFPFNVGRIDLSEVFPDKVHFLYLFDDEQIIRLIRKGLYHEGFNSPKSLEGSYIELPIKCHIRAVLPDPTPQDPHPAPMMFCGVEQPHTQVTDARHSGYDLEAEFEQMIDPQSIEATTDELQNAMNRTDEEIGLKTPMQSIVAQNATPILDYEEEDEPADLDADFQEIMERIYKKHPNALGYEKKDEIENSVRSAINKVGDKLRPQPSESTEKTADPVSEPVQNPALEETETAAGRLNLDVLNAEYPEDEHSGEEMDDFF